MSDNPTLASQPAPLQAPPGPAPAQACAPGGG